MLNRIALVAGYLRQIAATRCRITLLMTLHLNGPIRWRKQFGALPRHADPDRWRITE